MMILMLIGMYQMYKRRFNVLRIILWGIDNICVTAWSSDVVGLWSGKTIAWSTLLAVLSVVLGSNVLPSVRLLHMLFAV